MAQTRRHSAAARRYCRFNSNGALTTPSTAACVQIYLPIADLPVNIFLILGMGLAVGFISGMFGIGGGFLMTPLLIFIGISPAVAVASVASHIAASSFSGAISYWRRKRGRSRARLDAAGRRHCRHRGRRLAVHVLRALGQLDLTIGLSYVLLLGIVGGADGRRERARDPARRSRASRSCCGGRAATPGCTACRSRCASSARRSTSRRFRSGASASSSAFSARSWASAAASCWCRC